MNNTKNIILCGVGGQGTILASRILSVCLIESGYDVKMSEIHGMSQRGGSVTTQVRYGEKVHSPIMGKGEADILVAFEKMEALRYLEDLKPRGKVIVNDYSIPSAPVLSGKVDYPEDAIERINEKVSANVIDAARIAVDLGNSKTMNIVLLGAMVHLMDLEELNWEKVIKENVKPKFFEINMAAFEAGKDRFK